MITITAAASTTTATTTAATTTTYHDCYYYDCHNHCYCADSCFQAFKGSALPPVAFREVFLRVFLVKLTYPEIGALLSVFDEMGTGTIDGHKFLNAFYRLGEYSTFLCSIVMQKQDDSKKNIYLVR